MASSGDVDECAICYGAIAEATGVRGCAECARGDVRLHRQCVARSHHSDLLNERAPRCPFCRSPRDVVHVGVTTLTGSRLDVRVPVDACILDLKFAVECAFSVPHECSRIVFNGNQRGDHIDLAQAGITDGTSVHIVTRATELSWQLNAAVDGAVPHADAPQHLRCTLCRAVVTDPVRASDGKRYQRATLQKWMDRRGNRSPLTTADLLPLTNDDEVRQEAAAFLASAPPHIEEQPPSRAILDREIRFSAVLPNVVQLPVTGLRLRDDSAALLRNIAQVAGLAEVRVFFRSVQIEAGVPLWRYGLEGGEELFCHKRRTVV